MPVSQILFYSFLRRGPVTGSGEFFATGPSLYLGAALTNIKKRNAKTGTQIPRVQMSYLREHIQNSASVREEISISLYLSGSTHTAFGSMQPQGAPPLAPLPPRPWWRCPRCGEPLVPHPWVWEWLPVWHWVWSPEEGGWVRWLWWWAGCVHLSCRNGMRAATAGG